ncbi:MAG: hypothetical protein C0505_04095 [Leptothrix sp. (in: Bacteria)]|nr:hypothetical protein [Leptothrix sp. (in: b-proteobacteria)]
MQRRNVLFGLAGAASMALSGCAGLGGPPRLTLGEAEISRLMERHFPLERSLLEIFDVTVDAPRLRLLPERNRVAAVVDVRLLNRVFAGRWQGQLSFDSELRWSAADQTLRLSQVRVQDLALANPGTLERSTTERLGAALAERVLEASSIYRLPAERLAQLRAKGFEPAGVVVTPDGLEITFVPVPPAAAPR